MHILCAESKLQQGGRKGCAGGRLAKIVGAFLHHFFNVPQWRPGRRLMAGAQWRPGPRGGRDTVRLATAAAATK